MAGVYGADSLCAIVRLSLTAYVSPCRETLETTNELSSTEVLSTVTGDLLKTDMLVRVTLCCKQREAMLDAFVASGMSGQAFALQHGIKIQTFASWIQKR